MRKKIMIAGLAAAVVMAITIGILYMPYLKAVLYTRVTDDILEGIDLDGYDKLMIVAHPDDETLWGGAHLLEDDYFVICLTDSDNKKRNAEFRAVIEALGDKYLMLDYPDKVAGKKSNWNVFKKNISIDIQKIIEYKDWELIVTHNAEGEYGHIHHKHTNKIVSALVSEDSEKLWFFGKYYRAKELEQIAAGELNIVLPEEISEEALARKNEVLELYKSQSKVVDCLGHMNRYEDWTYAAEK